MYICTHIYIYIHRFRHIQYTYQTHPNPFRHGECQELGPHVVPAGLLRTPDAIQGRELQRLPARDATRRLATAPEKRG